MKIGIEFNIPNEYGNFLEQILKQINLDEYIWKIEEDEIYINNNRKSNDNDDNLFKKPIYKNADFKKIIEQEDYYIIFANIKLYVKQDNTIINTYKDFIESSCILILLVTVSKFVEIYSKDENILDKIYNNALKSKFHNICYITKENFKRKKFSAYAD